MTGKGLYQAASCGQFSDYSDDPMEEQLREQAGSVTSQRTKKDLQTLGPCRFRASVWAWYLTYCARRARLIAHHLGDMSTAEYSGGRDFQKGRSAQCFTIPNRGLLGAPCTARAAPRRPFTSEPTA